MGGTTTDPTVDDLLNDKGKGDAAGASDQGGDKDKGKGEGDQLFAGKYKTVEELVKAYESSNSENSRLAQENAKLKEPKPSDDKDDKGKEVTIEDLQESYKENPVKTVLWMLKNIGREQTTEVVKQHLENRDAETDEATTKAQLRQEYPDLGNKDSKLYQEAAKQYSALGEKIAKADPARALRISVEKAATVLGITKTQVDEAQRRADVDAHGVEESQGRGEGKKLALNDEEKTIARNLGITEEEYLKGLDTQGGRRVRVTKKGG